MTVNERFTSARIGWLRIHVHEWTGSRPETWNARVEEIVRRRESYDWQKRKTGPKWLWVITDLTTKDVPEGPLIEGVLRKIRKDAIDRVFDFDTWNVKEIPPVAAAIEAGAPFTIFVREHLIAHRLTGINQRDFAEAFRAILTKDTGLSPPALNPIVDKREFLSVVRSMRSVHSVRIRDLTPSNPETDEDFAQADEIMKRLRIEHGDFAFRSSQGLNISRGEMISQYLALAARGYGTAIATGEMAPAAGLAGKPVTISTRSKAIIHREKVKGNKGFWEKARELLPSVRGAEDSPDPKVKRPKKSKGKKKAGS